MLVEGVWMKLFGASLEGVGRVPMRPETLLH